MGGPRGGRGGGGGRWGRSNWKNQRGGGGGGNWGRNRGGGNSKSGPAAIPEGVDPNNPMVAIFQEHASALDLKHDKQERIVKLSRDITAESKKIIFLLHRITCEDDKPTVLGEAEVKMVEVKKRYWFPLAAELRGEDHFRFLRAYTGGLQEYVEALSFYHYLCYGRLIQWKEVQDDLTFKRKYKKRKNPSGGGGSQTSTAKTSAGEDGEADGKKEQEDKDEEKMETATQGAEKESKDDNEVSKEVATLSLSEEKSTDTEKTEPPVEASDPNKSAESVKEETMEEEEVVTSVCVPRTDFVLGLADLTGEVMRQAINGVGLGNVAGCFDLLDFLHEIHGGFVMLPRNDLRERFELERKLKVLRQSMRKVENACYNINVRGTEVPKHMLKGRAIHMHGPLLRQQPRLR